MASGPDTKQGNILAYNELVQHETATVQSHLLETMHWGPDIERYKHALAIGQGKLEPLGIDYARSATNNPVLGHDGHSFWLAAEAKAANIELDDGDEVRRRAKAFENRLHHDAYFDMLNAQQSVKSMPDLAPRQAANPVKRALGRASTLLLRLAHS